MDWRLASVSHVFGPPSANMGVFAACVSHVEEPPSASMGVAAADARKQITNISIWIDRIFESTYIDIGGYTRSPTL